MTELFVSSAAIRTLVQKRCAPSMGAEVEPGDVSKRCQTWHVGETAARGTHQHFEPKLRVVLGTSRSRSRHEQRQKSNMPDDRFDVRGGEDTKDDVT